MRLKAGLCFALTLTLAVHALACSGSGLDSLGEAEVAAPDSNTSPPSPTFGERRSDAPVPEPLVDGGESASDDALTSSPDAADGDRRGEGPREGDPAEECESGCFGNPCEENEDCLSGLCAEHMGDSVCTKTCEDECPAGWSCEAVDAGGDVPTYVCVSNFEHLCRPCMTGEDCTSTSSEAVCVTYPGEGSFCGATCEGDDECPDGFVCQEATSTRGGASSQCVNVEGVCECSSLASALGLGTTCEFNNEAGTCSGARFCSSDGLSACDAKVPESESCNGLDDNCDGEIDEVGCDDNNPCTIDTCLGEAGCEYLVSEGADCDDGDLATGNDRCTAEGLCEGQPLECPLSPCVLEATPNGSGCDLTYAPVQSPCDDGDAATKEDQCDGQGGCAGTPYACEPGLCETASDPNGTDCTITYTALGTPCDDNQLGTKDDQCDGEGGCVGTPFTCTPSQCEASSVADGQGCAVTPKSAGVACDDGDLTTSADACDGAGGCAGTPYVCEPGPCEASSTHNGIACVVEYWAQGAACDDGDPTTKDDQCNGAGGCAGTPYTCAPAMCELSAAPNGEACEVTFAPAESACDDGDPSTLSDICDGQGGCSGTPYTCTPDQCDAASTPNGVGCDITPKGQGLPCNDGDDTTKEDSCDGQGGCAGTPYTCTPSICVLTSVPDGAGCALTFSPAQSACDDGDPSTQFDQCDGEGQCAGTPYACQASQCETSSTPNGEGCEVTFKAQGLPCDDGDPNTQVDICDGTGTCVGTPYGCEPTQCEAESVPDGVGCLVSYKAQGVPCDDGEATTKEDVCDGSGGCSGNEYTCVAEQCEAQSVPDGDGCAVTLHGQGVACDDDDPTTALDVCDGNGGCAGSPYTCTPSQCEGSSLPNGVDCDVTYMAPGVACDDGDPNTQGDACDGAGGCLGSPYLCTPNACQISSEPNGVGCDVVNQASGFPCDDADPNTQGDVCNGQGACIGTPYTCEATQCQLSSTPNGLNCDVINKASGSPCDDADPNTQADSCDGAGACVGTPYTCTPSQCEASSTANGVDCTVVNKPPTAGCNDGEITTKNDLCDGAGGCAGTPYTCEPSQCEEASAPNGVDCDPTFSALGTPCDDLDLATVDDACDGSGSCVGQSTVCGDGVTEGAEACDSGDDLQLDCPYGEESCTVCGAQCTYIAGNPGGYCGDNVTQVDFEDCDDGNSSNTDACVASCVDATCGDLYVEAGIEECDDGNLINDDGCSNTCQLASAEAITVGGTGSAWGASNYFRGNTFSWEEGAVLKDFDVYLTGAPGGCQLHFYVHDMTTGSTSAPLWSAIRSAQAGESYHNSGAVELTQRGTRLRLWRRMAVLCDLSREQPGLPRPWPDERPPQLLGQQLPWLQPELWPPEHWR